MLPDHGFIGAEPFLNGVATALGHIRDKHLANVRLWRGDALEVLQRVPDGALSFLYLLHPDPWPKARHAKRRMVNDGPVDLFAAKLKPGGEFRLATDDPTYLTWSLMVMQRHADQFEWLAERPKDFLEPSGGWIETRYGAKSRREGRRPYYLRYRSLLTRRRLMDIDRRTLISGAAALPLRGFRRFRRAAATIIGKASRANMT